MTGVELSCDVAGACDRIGTSLILLLSVRASSAIDNDARCRTGDVTQSEGVPYQFLHRPAVFFLAPHSSSLHAFGRVFWYERVDDDVLQLHGPGQLPDCVEHIRSLSLGGGTGQGIGSVCMREGARRRGGK